MKRIVYLCHVLITVLMVLVVQTSIVIAGQVARPGMMSESLYADKYYSDPPRDALVWSKTLLEMKIQGFTPQLDTMSEYNSCNYKSALMTLQEMKEQLGEKSSYLKIWVMNQVKVLEACEGREGNDKPPVRPKTKALPKRAESDYQYQLASWNFYRKNYQAALTAYKKIGKMKDAPQRANAAYMVVRTLAYLNRSEDAYHEIDKILSDRSLKNIHDMTRNYRFVIMSNTRSYEMDITPALAIEHLRWLQKFVQLNKNAKMKTELLMAEQKDALDQFNLYFPVYAPGSKEVDWWLTPGVDENPRMQAVKTLALNNPFIDWTQARWAYNVFDHDWLWAFHKKDDPYWEQNKNIVQHALEQWKKTGDGVWLQIAIKRVHPMDNAAQRILSISEPYLDRPWEKETPEYRLWLFDLWTNIIRIRLGKGEIDKVEAIIVKYKDLCYKGLFSLPESKDYTYRQYDFLSVLGSTLKWLMYSGQIERARSFLGLFKTHYHNEFYWWRCVLATNLDDADSVAVGTGFNFSEFLKDDSLWAGILNLLPSSVLYKIATNEGLKIEKRALIARTIFTRAILLEYDNDQLDTYAVLAAKLNPAIREQILESIAGHDRNKYISFLLKMPRFRPVVNLGYAEDPERSGHDKGTAIDAIDIYNHNDNNWWCRYDDEALYDTVFRIMQILPVSNDIFTVMTRKKPIEPSVDNEGTTDDPNMNNEGASVAETDDVDIDPEFEPYLDRQEELLDQHPYMKRIDLKEIEALKRIPSAPQYLCEAVIKRELETKPAATPEERNERAANLHRAIRSTRYGCSYDGPHGKYSRQVYKLLHKNYGDTSWAKATPYWFD